MCDNTLKIIAPEPVEIPMELQLGDKKLRKVWRIRPLNLADQKFIVDNWQGKDLLEEALKRGDLKPIVTLFVHQLAVEDKLWFMEQVAVASDSELVEFMMSATVSPEMVNVLLAAMFKAWEKSVPPPMQDGIKKKVAYSMMKWWFISYLVLGAVLGACGKYLYSLLYSWWSSTNIFG